jgi:hypothetical protein
MIVGVEEGLLRRVLFSGVPIESFLIRSTLYAEKRCTAPVTSLPKTGKRTDQEVVMIVFLF